MRRYLPDALPIYLAVIGLSLATFVIGTQFKKGSTMWVKFKTTACGPSGGWDAGEVREVDDKTGQKLIEDKVALLTDRPVPRGARDISEMGSMAGQAKQTGDEAMRRTGQLESRLEALEPIVLAQRNELAAFKDRIAALEESATASVGTSGSLDTLAPTSHSTGKRRP